MIVLWLKAFLLTLLSELSLMRLVVKKPWRRQLTKRCLLANCLSHPCLWFVYPRFFPYALWLFSGEVLVVLLETAVYGIRGPNDFGLKRAFLLSLVLNLFSCALGFLLL